MVQQNTIITNKRDSFLLISIIGLAVFITRFDVSVVNISLPVIAGSMNTNISHISNLILSYLLFTVCFILPAGKLGDLLGFKKVFISGIAVFTIASCCCSFTENLTVLIIFRSCQGIGAAMISTMALAIFTVSLPADIRGRSLGWIVTAAAIGIAVGPGIGGLVSWFLHWRWIFMINVPIGILIMLVAVKVVPDCKLTEEKVKFDVPGTILFLGALAVFLYFLKSGNQAFWNLHTALLYYFILSFILLSAFLFWERKTSNPMIKLTLFKNWNFTAGNIVSATIFIINMGVYFIFPFYMKILGKLTSLERGGLMMLPPIVIILLSPLTGRLSDRIGSRIPCLTGITLAMIAFLICCLNLNYYTMIIVLILFGFSFAFDMAPLTRLIMSSSSAEHGTVSAVMIIIRKVAGLLGICFCEVVLSLSHISLHHSTLLSAGVKSHHVLQSAFQNIFLSGFIISLIGLVLMLTIKEKV